MKFNLQELLQSKTAWLGISGIIAGATLIIHGNVNEGIQAIVAGLALIFVKDAIVSSGK